MGALLPSAIGVDSRGPVPVNHAASRDGPHGNAPPGPAGRGHCRRGQSLRWAVGTGPDQAVALAVLIVEEVGEDRGGEARIVELEAQIVSALVGALGPGGADLDSTDVDAVTGAVVAGAVGFGNDPDVLGLDREGDDLAGEFVRAGLLEGAEVAMVLLLDLCFRARTIAASMVIEGPEAIDGAPRRGSTAKEGLSCLGRNNGAAGRGRKF
jgi:hypothetical protein